jgi:hypothetical protein
MAETESVNLMRNRIDKQDFFKSDAYRPQQRP